MIAFGLGVSVGCGLGLFAAWLFDEWIRRPPWP